MPDPLTLDQVRHVAKLARLTLTDSQAEAYRTQLSAILEYVNQLTRLDVTGVEPMAHPLPMTNRLDEDVVAPSMPIHDLLRNAPAANGPFLIVPKVLDDVGGGA